MSFLSALFGRRAGAQSEKVGEPVEYKGFVIRAAPFKNEGHYQTAGIIEREIDGVRKEHRFIRADSYATYEDAANFSLSKARGSRSKPTRNSSNNTKHSWPISRPLATDFSTFSGGEKPVLDQRTTPKPRPLKSFPSPMPTGPT